MADHKHMAEMMARHHKERRMMNTKHEKAHRDMAKQHVEEMGGQMGSDGADMDAGEE